MIPHPTTGKPMSSSAVERTEAIPIDRLQPLKIGWVVDVQGGDGDADRLKRMGICVGRQIQLVKAGNPLILRVHGSRLGLSARLAKAIWVAPVEICPDSEEDNAGVTSRDDPDADSTTLTTN